MDNTNINHIEYDDQDQLLFRFYMLDNTVSIFFLKFILDQIRNAHFNILHILCVHGRNATYITYV